MTINDIIKTLPICSILPIPQNRRSILDITWQTVSVCRVHMSRQTRLSEAEFILLLARPQTIIFLEMALGHKLERFIPDFSVAAKSWVAKQHMASLGDEVIGMDTLEGKVAIVTGGARGIGEATVRIFVKNGAKVAIADIEDTSGTILANELYTSAIYVHCDVSLEDDTSKT
ncbi:unnamed protein product [Prunus brigantina]